MSCQAIDVSSTGSAFLSAWSHDAFVSKHRKKDKEQNIEDPALRAGPSVRDGLTTWRKKRSTARRPMKTAGGPSWDTLAAILV